MPPPFIEADIAKLAQGQIQLSLHLRRSSSNQASETESYKPKKQDNILMDRFNLSRQTCRSPSANAGTHNPGHLLLGKVSSVGASRVATAYGSLRSQGRRGDRVCVRDLAARSARAFQIRCPSLETEGAGNAGCALHPRSRVPVAQTKGAHEHTGER